MEGNFQPSTENLRAKSPEMDMKVNSAPKRLLNIKTAYQQVSTIGKLKKCTKQTYRCKKVIAAKDQEGFMIKQWGKHVLVFRTLR